MCVRAVAATDAASVARLVQANDIEPALSDALRSSDALVRATAARVAGVRNAKSALPALREALAQESDASAVREEIRTLALIGETADVDLAIDAAAKRSQAFDEVVADAVGRRGGEEAIDLYMKKVRKLRDTANFFTRALWGHENQISTTAGWLLSSREEKGWRQLLGAMFNASKMVPYARMIAALDSGSEDIRQESAWFLVRGYAVDPSSMNETLRGALLMDRTEEASDREDFARELLRRMLGKPPSNPQRWLKWLASEEADRRLPTEPAVYTHLTAQELALRESRCKTLPVACPVTPKSDRVYPSEPVARAAFSLPSTLPPGLADQLLRGKSCEWIGVASATVDRAGRVQSVDLKNVTATCRDLLEAILKLSYATNSSLDSETTSGNILLVKARKSVPCLDEVEGDRSAVWAGSRDVQPPIVIKRVEPLFPESARRSMGRDSSVVVIVESTISRAGCVRSINLVKQSQWPELNGAAVMALSQWQFAPAKRDGKPIEVVFDLTIHFKIGR